MNEEFDEDWDAWDEAQDEESLPVELTRAMHRVAHELAHAFLAGPGDASSLRQRAEHALGRPWPWLPALCLRLHYDWPQIAAAHDPQALTTRILADSPYQAAFGFKTTSPTIRAWTPWHPRMHAPPPALAGITLPQLPTAGALADWLGIAPQTLLGYADPQSRKTPAGQPGMAHYRYLWHRKANGEARLIEAPKTRLRALQGHILHGILARVPAHPAAHGCLRRHSPLTYAQPHAGHALLIKLDCRDFFSGITRARVRAVFRSLGYPEECAHLLASLCTHRSPASVLRQMPMPETHSPEARQALLRRTQLLECRHLPQGAPTSPMLANLVAYRLDCRLTGLARACDGVYTRYVDDLAFSLNDPDPARARRIKDQIIDILNEEGFTPNHRKTRIVTSSQAQRLCGIVINHHPNPARADYEQLKAILHNCLKHGPTSQNREQHPNFRAHLQGRLAWFQQINPARAEKLQGMFARIAWN